MGVLSKEKALNEWRSNPFKGNDQNKKANHFETFSYIKYYFSDDL